MRFDDKQLLWAMGTLSENGHPDPEGLIAYMESSDAKDGNVAGVDPQDAARYGVPHVDEPMMSMYAAMRRDIDAPEQAAYGSQNTADVRTRVDQALVQQLEPSNPFMDSQGMLVSTREPKRKPPSDKATRQIVMDLLDEYS